MTIKEQIRIDKKAFKDNTRLRSWAFQQATQSADGIFHFNYNLWIWVES